MMKKGLLALLLAAGTFIGCQDNSTDVPSEQQAVIDMSDFYVHTDEYESKGATKDDKQCHSMQVLNRQLAENKGLYKKMNDI